MTIQKIGHRCFTLAALLNDALRELLKNDPLRMAAATAFFTTFALPPILVILIQVFRLVLDPHTIRVELFKSLDGIVGPEAVRQLVDVLKAIRSLAQNWYITIGGFIFLLFVATTLFKIIKSSINQIWKIRPVHNATVLKGLRTRLQSFAVILVAGILFMAGIVTEGARALVGSYIAEFSPQLSFYIDAIGNHFVSTVVVTAWFSIVFRYLPDSRPAWRVAFAGGLLTAILFAVGKIILHWLLTYSNINTVYGASASIVLLLLFVFYSALILYYGAAFTTIWATYSKHPIKPLPHAMRYRLIEADMEEE